MDWYAILISEDFYRILNKINNDDDDDDCYMFSNAPYMTQLLQVASVQL